MPSPVSPVPWLGSVLWLMGLAVAAFLVSWIAADKLGLRRTAYIAVLAVVTGAMTVGYVGWLGLSMYDVVTPHWLAGLVVAPLAGLFLILGIRRLPAGPPLTGRHLALAFGWEGVVYGVTEGLLLSTLPVLMTWEAIHSLGWSGPAGALARWTLPLLASVAVIVIHHLGYWEYRNRLLRPIAVGCGLMSLGYLVTASPLAPTLAHVLGHASSLQHGSELPPHAHGAPPSSLWKRVMDDTAIRGGR